MRIRALQLLALIAIAGMLVFLAGQPHAYTAIQKINATVRVICPFAVSINPLASYTLPANVNINFALRTLYTCSIPLLTGTLQFSNSSGVIYSGNVIGYNVIASNSFYVISASNSLFHYGTYTANIVFTNFGAVNGSSASFQILSPIYSNTLTPSNSVADQGQYQVIRTVLGGGTAPFSYNYIVTNAIGAQVASAFYTGVSSSNTFTFLLSPSYGTGTFTVNVIVKDTSAPSNTAVNSATFGVNSLFSSTSFFPLSSTLTNTEPQLVEAAVSGGTPNYNFNFYIYNAVGALVDQSLNNLQSGTSDGFIYQQQTAWGTGTFTANVIVTDTATSYATVTNTLTYTVTGGTSTTTTSTTVTSTIPNGGNGGGGGGGGGVQKPTVLNLQDGVLVIGIAPLNTFNVTILGVRLNATNNFIGPTSAGMTINGNSYLLTQNGTQNITQSRNPNYIYTMQLYNISWTPVLHTIALLIKAVPSGIPINITSDNTTLEIRTYNNSPTQIRLYGENTILNISSETTAFKILSVRNLTNSKALPPLPRGYVKQLIQQINMTSAPNQHNVHLNATIGVRVAYNCSLPYYKVIPFVLANYSWKQVNTFTIDIKTCTVVMTFNGDPILALTRYTGANQTSTTTVSFTTTATTTVTSTTVTQNEFGPKINFNGWYIIVPIVLLVIIAILVIIYRRRGKKPKSKERKGSGKSEHVGKKNRKSSRTTKGTARSSSRKRKET